MHLALGLVVRLVCVIMVLRMLMLMMTGMRCRHFIFMLAINGRSSPGNLERQNHQQENEEEFFHGANHITEVVALRVDILTRESHIARSTRPRKPNRGISGLPEQSAFV